MADHVSFDCLSIHTVRPSCLALHPCHLTQARLALSQQRLGHDAREQSFATFLARSWTACSAAMEIPLHLCKASSCQNRRCLTPAEPSQVWGLIIMQARDHAPRMLPAISSRSSPPSQTMAIHGPRICAFSLNLRAMVLVLGVAAAPLAHSLPQVSNTTSRDSHLDPRICRADCHAVPLSRTSLYPRQATARRILEGRLNPLSS